MSSVMASSPSQPSPPSSLPTPPLAAPSPPPPPPPPPPQYWNVNLLHSLALSWPLNTNFVTILQTRYIAHSFFTPTYLSPLHPSAASSSSTHPTYQLCRTWRDIGVRPLWSHEGFWRGLFRGMAPSIASIGVRGYVLSEGVVDANASDNGTLLSSGARTSFQRDAAHGDSDEFGLMLQLYLPYIDPQRVPFATLAAYPLDHIRTLMQLAQHNTSAVPAAHSALAPAGSAVDYILTTTSTSATASLRTLVQQYGITSIYRGVVPALVGQTALLGSGLSLFDEVVQWMRSNADDQMDENISTAETSEVKESERKIVFPLSLVDRLSNSPPLLSSAAVFLSSYLLVFYPASVISTHMRAATFSSAHISSRPLGPPPHPTASHHLHAYAASSPPATSTASLPGVMATIRRIGSEQGVRGFYRGFTLHVCKGHMHNTHMYPHTCSHGFAQSCWLTSSDSRLGLMFVCSVVALMGVWCSWVAGLVWLTSQGEDG